MVEIAIFVIAAVTAAALTVLLEQFEGLPATIALHAALMLMAWSVLMPSGAVVARYFKVTARQDFPRETNNLFWWRWHRTSQYTGMAAATVAIVAILRETGGRFNTWHSWCGLVVLGLGGLQIVSTWLRGSRGGPGGEDAVAADPLTWRGDHYDMTTRRLAFEFWHKPVGWAVLVLAGVTELLGIALIGTPSWLLAVTGGLQAAAVLGVVDGRLRRRWVDTYHALWGPDAAHPGNRRVGRNADRQRSI